MRSTKQNDFFNIKNKFVNSCNDVEHLLGPNLFWILIIPFLPILKNWSLLVRCVINDLSLSGCLRYPLVWMHRAKVRRLSDVTTVNLLIIVIAVAIVIVVYAIRRFLILNVVINITIITTFHGVYFRNVFILILAVLRSLNWLRSKQ